MVNKLYEIKNNKKGFTLVEVIVAAAIVAIVSIMIVTAFMTSSRIRMKAADSKEEGREIDFDIYMNEALAASSEVVKFNLTQDTDGDPDTPNVPIDGLQLPLNIKTFMANSGDGAKEIMIFRQ